MLLSSSLMRLAFITRVILSWDSSAYTHILQITMRRSTPQMYSQKKIHKDRIIPLQNLQCTWSRASLTLSNRCWLPRTLVDLRLMLTRVACPSLLICNVGADQVYWKVSGVFVAKGECDNVKMDFPNIMFILSISAEHKYISIACVCSRLPDCLWDSARVWLFQLQSCSAPLLPQE